MNLLTKTVAAVTPVSQEYRDKAVAHIESLTMPRWALGKALDLAVDIAGITQSITPSLARKKCLVFGADHGITAEGVSPIPNAVTMVMMRNFVETKGAAINVLANQIGAEVVVVDMGIAMRDEIEDLIVVEREDGATVFKRHEEADFASWLDEYSVGELWEKNILGGRPKK